MTMIHIELLTKNYCAGEGHQNFSSQSTGHGQWDDSLSRKTVKYDRDPYRTRNQE
jgi:hypothetical protein